MAKPSPSDIATRGTANLAAHILLAPYYNYNEGQKILITDYTSIECIVDVDVKTYRLGDIAVFTSRVNRNYIDIEGYVEEAFGSLYDDVEEICARFAQDAFNMLVTGNSIGDLVDGVLENWEDAYQMAYSRMSVFI